MKRGEKMSNDKTKTPLELITELETYKKSLKEAQELIKVLERNISNTEGSLCKVLPDKKWVFYQGKLYGESSTNWGGHTSQLNILEAKIPNMQDGDEIQDWTDKLGYHQVNYD